METKKKASRGKRYLSIGGAILVIGLLFKGEILALVAQLSKLSQMLPAQAITISDWGELLKLAIFLLFYGGMVYFYYRLLLFLVSQILLPVRNEYERREVLKRFHNYLFGEAFPFVIVQEGKAVTPLPASGKVSHGVLLVDASSAVVLEKSPGKVTTDRSAYAGPKVKRGEKALSQPITRIGVPGWNFMDPGEVMREIVHLRKQIRRSPTIHALTSDGVNVETQVTTVFTLGQPPAVIKVAYCQEGPEGICELEIDEDSREIRAMHFDLEAQDRIEMHLFAQHFLKTMGKNDPLLPLENYNEHPPYHIDAARLTAAVYSKGLTLGEQQKESTWMDIPVLEAAKVLRDLLSKVPYEWLYRYDDQDGRVSNLQKFSGHFARHVRNKGVLAYQFVHRQDDMPPQVGQRVTFREFRISPMQILNSPQSLRLRGIKVVSASFSDLKPQEEVLLSWLNEWRARLMDDQKTGRGVRELEMARVIEQARRNEAEEFIQRMWRSLHIQRAQRRSVLLSRMLKNLDELAHEPQVLRLLPQETVNYLRDLRMWASSEEDRG